MDIASVVSGGFNARDATTPGAFTDGAGLQGCANCPELPSPAAKPPELLSLSASPSASTSPPSLPGAIGGTLLLELLDCLPPMTNSILALLAHP